MHQVGQSSGSHDRHMLDSRAAHTQTCLPMRDGLLSLFIPYTNKVSNTVSKEGNHLPRGGMLGAIRPPLGPLSPLHTMQQFSSPWGLRS